MMQVCLRRLWNTWYYSSTIVRSWFWSTILGTRGLTVYGPITIHHPQNVAIGNDCTINHWCLLNARAPLIIGQRVRISAGCMITTAGLQIRVPAGERRRHQSAAVTIGDDVWIGAGAMVMPGVTIGPRTVVGAGAVVSRDLPADIVAVGVPAKPIDQKA